MEIPIKQKLFYFFPVLLCFCLPFGNRTGSVVIAAWVLTSFFNLELKQIKIGLKNRNLQLLILFFLLTCISGFTSMNKTEGLFNIEVKLVFLLFPYLLFCFNWPSSILKRCIVAFVSGCFFASIFLIARAFYYSASGHPEYFFYTLFSDLIHASYFAMYLVMAITFVVIFYHRWFSSQKSVMYSSYFFIAVFIITIFLCASKLGIISFFIGMPLLLLYKFKERLNFKLLMILGTSIIFILIAGYNLFPDSFSRLNSLKVVSIAPDKTSSESTAVRMLIWEQAAGLIKDNLLIGTGVGDANTSLFEAYTKNGITGALAHKLNAHNQFLQTFIGMGIVGFIILLTLTFGQLFVAIANKNFLLLMFALLIILNFLVESMLQTSAGVLFFTFFFCVLNLTNEEKLFRE